MTGEDRTTPRPDPYGPLDVEAFCAAMGIPVETYLEVTAAVAEKFPSTADAGYIDATELTRLRAIEEAARTVVQAQDAARSLDPLRSTWEDGEDAELVQSEAIDALRAALKGPTHE